MGFDITGGGPSVQETLDLAAAGNEDAKVALAVARRQIMRGFDRVRASLIPTGWPR